MKCINAYTYFKMLAFMWHSISNSNLYFSANIAVTDFHFDLSNFLISQLCRDQSLLFLCDTTFFCQSLFGSVVCYLQNGLYVSVVNLVGKNGFACFESITLSSNLPTRLFLSFSPECKIWNFNWKNIFELRVIRWIGDPS